ncbi:MAG: UDP-glucose/GDP-mannose dehydrogenase family protein [Selenomonadaceae bacterium]|nr:UDP-glucose/GDP-mannose dehydrogenase family protein [Selenomonadaceae bacterium]
MNITVVGTGYVGLVTGVCFSEMGNQVYCVDTDKEKIDSLNKGEIPIYEPGLESMVENNVKLEHLYFTTELPVALNHSNICFIAVGTPMGENGEANLEYVKNAAMEIGQNMTHHMYVVNKSTVPVGTADMVRSTIKAELDKRNVDLTFDVISNPEFLKEGAAVSDCMRPERVIIGADNPEAVDIMRELYRAYVKNTEHFIVMDIKSAEMTKYAANAMLATKISFMNEISNICDHVGADVNKVRLGIGSDPRIGYNFIYPGCGYGGSCFPKDVQALIHMSIESNYDPQILKAIEIVNDKQKRILVKKIVRHFGEDLSGKHFAVWGLSFKPNTNDMRYAPSVTIINELLSKGATITAYDPKAMPEAQQHYFNNLKNISYAKNKYEALQNADALVLVTEWKEFRQPNFERMATLMKEAVIFDGRNQYDKHWIKKYGFKYYQIGVK